MTRETLIILVKAVFTLFGSYLIGDNIFGTTIDYDLWQVIAGIVLSLISAVWSYTDKTYTIESLQATARQVILFFGGLLISSGRMTNEQLMSISGIVMALIPIVQSYLSKKKAQKVQDGRIEVQALASIPKKTI